jgi:nicotinate-nucleotide adenylyltransferase
MRLGVLGGALNPVHIGHLRAGIEVLESLGLDGVLVMPTFAPPHRPSHGLLDYGLRLALVRSAVAGIPGLEASDLESRLPEPSYTIRTLEHLAREQGGARPTFIMGPGEFTALDSWHRGRELLGFADLAVVRRQDAAVDDLVDFGLDFWAGEGVVRRVDDALVLDSGGRVDFLSTPRLDVSATLVRERWLAGRSISCLVPGRVRTALEAESQKVREAWSRAAG